MSVAADYGALAVSLCLIWCFVVPDLSFSQMEYLNLQSLRRKVTEHLSRVYDVDAQYENTDFYR